MNDQIIAVGAASMLFLGGISLATESLGKSSTVWDTLDIVPMPKNIQLTGDDLVLDPKRVIMVIGTDAGRQSVIGADWINQRLAEVADAPELPIVAAAEIPADKTAIIIGTVDDNPLVAQAVRDGLINVGAGNPVRRGYEIRRSSDGRRIYLAGADDIGVLYACVTFGELLEKRDVCGSAASNGSAGNTGNAVWRAAEVRDWPDQISQFNLNGLFTSYDEVFPIMPRTLTEANKKAYLDGIRQVHDYLLRRKLTGVHYRGRALGGEKYVHTPQLDLLREGIEHGKERGIGALSYHETPYPGLIKYYPEQAEDTNKIARISRNPGGKWLVSWSHDDIRRETARNLAEYIKAAGFTDVGFHDTDAGWLDNPADWNFRSEYDRERWGDDYTAATIHIHKTYHDELSKLNPDLNIHFVFYPYTIYIFDTETFSNLWVQARGKSANTMAVLEGYQQKYGEFWRRLNEAFPYRNVTFCARESTWESVLNWRKFITDDRAIFWWNAVGNKYWEPIFSQAPAWASGFADHPDNMIAIAYADMEGIPLNNFAVREYTWNRQTPGADHFKGFSSPGTDAWKWAEPEGDIYDMVLPRIVRNIFGRQATPYILRAVSRNIDVKQALGRVRSSTYDLLKTPERRQWQADNAEQAADALNELWDKCRETNTRMGMDESAFASFVVMREVLNGCKWFSKAKARLMFAEVSAGENNLEEAEQHITKAGEYVKAGETFMAQLIEERPEAIIGRRTTGKAFTADTIDFSMLASNIAHTAENLVHIAERSGKHKLIMNNLAKGREVGGYRMDGTADITIDGIPDESVWNNAPAVDCFTVIGQPKLADAFTSVRIVRDTDYIYFGWVCYAPPGKTIQDKDTLDIFLNIPEMNQDKLLELFISADGGFFCSIPETDLITRAIKREQDYWSGELRIRIELPGQQDQKSAPWKVNLCRNCYYKDSPTQISALLPPDAASKRALTEFPTIQFSTQPAPAPVVALNVKDFNLRTVTLPDRIASVASFYVEIDANMVLNQAMLIAETYGSDGKMQRRRELDEFAHIFLHESPTALYETEFDDNLDKGGVLIILKTREGEFKRWIRFGGWEGAAGKGDIFSPSGMNGGKALAGPCFFLSRIMVDDTPVNLIDAEHGTIELWMTPATRTRPSREDPVRAQGEALVSFNAYKKGANPIVNHLPLGIVMYRNAFIAFTAGERARARWTASAPVSDPLATGEWHHLACVWDAGAPTEDQTRIYLDGRKLPAKVDINRVGHLPDTSLRLGIAPPHTIQIGALKSGYYQADMLINELRISRIARYHDDFEPSPEAFMPDKNTSALFPFNGSLKGVGMTASGKSYNIHARAGIDF